MHKPDEMVVKDQATKYTPHSEGQHAMICVDTVDLGVKLDTYRDQPPEEKRKLALVFASGETQENGELILVTTEMTYSMGEKANLRKFLESWRGKSYTPEQAQQGVPIHKLYGHSALVTVEHIQTRRGRTFARIVNISPLPKQMTAPGGLLEQYERPKFLTDRKEQYARELAAHDPRTVNEGEYDADADDIPF